MNIVEDKQHVIIREKIERLKRTRESFLRNNTIGLTLTSVNKPA